MATELPPDPYLALAVARDASAGAIKTSYRKLVLKFHPDKVTDEAQKQIASDQFHKIQTAYEIIGDEDRRARYDAQCKLAELRKEVMERQGAPGPRVDVRTAAYRMPTDSPGRTVFSSRGPERSDRAHVEERRPFDTEYFDRPRASTRKDYDYERPKRSSPREDRERPRPVTRQDTKENEKHRQKEKVKQASKDVKRDRGAKYAYVEPESDSDSGPGEAARRRRDVDEDPRRAREAYYEQARRQQEENLRGAFMDERVKKMFTDVDTAKDYIQRSRVPSARQHPEMLDERPSPARQASNRDKIEYIRRSESGKPPVMVRRGSSKPTVVERDDEDLVRHATRKEHRRRASDETEETLRRPPTLAQSRSAPGNIRLPQDEPRRSYSLQVDSDHKEAPRPPGMRRAETMPAQQPTSRKPAKASALRHTEFPDGYPTPSVTPDSPTNPASKYQYGREYADDLEYPTPAGYRTEVREPTGRKLTRSPSPIKDERPRAASSRMPPSAARPTPINTRTTSYKITPQGSHEDSRPSMSRHESSRSAAYPLYGEVPMTRSPKPTAKYSPAEDEGRYAREFRPEQVRVQSGYNTSTSRRGSEQRPSYSRQGSWASPVSAR